MAALAPVSLPPQLGPEQRCGAGSDSDVDECWICLSSAGVLTRPCACPRLCHRECIATWQLTNYGRREENYCRFCNKRLPALWKPDPAKEAEREELRVAPVMAVRYNGPEGTREFKLRVRPGPEGLSTFKAHLKEILGFDVGPEFDVTFECQMPVTGSMLTLSGLNAYGAATHCAALLAARKAGGGAADMHVGSAAATPTDNQTEGPMPVAPLISDPSSTRRFVQQQQGFVQQQRQQQQLVLPPSEAPSAAAALQTAAEAPTASSSRVGRCSSSSNRRVCQTGYVTNTPIILQQQQQALHDAAIARYTTARQYGSVASYSSYRNHRRPAGASSAVRSLNAAAASGRLGCRRTFRNLSSDAAQVGISMRDLVGYDNSYDDLDDLLPCGRRHVAALAATTQPTGFAAAAAAADGGGGAGSRSGLAAHAPAAAGRQSIDTVESGEAKAVEGMGVTGGSAEGWPATAPGNLWTAGAVRFGGLEVLPMSPSSLALTYIGGAPTGAAAAATAIPAIRAVAHTAPRPHRAVVGSRGGAYDGAATVAAIDAAAVSGDGGSSVSGTMTAAMTSWSAFSTRDVSVDSSHVIAAPAPPAPPLKDGHSQRQCGGQIRQRQLPGGDGSGGGDAVASVAAGAAAVGVMMEGFMEDDVDGRGGGVTSQGRRATRMRSALKRVAASFVQALCMVGRN